MTDLERAARRVLEMLDDHSIRVFMGFDSTSEDDAYLRIADLRAALDQPQSVDGTLMARLREANSLLRSAASIASRAGSQTNWRAFAGQVKKELQREHPLMYPDHAETCGDPECRFHKPDYRAFLREIDGTPKDGE